MGQKGRLSANLLAWVGIWPPWHVAWLRPHEREIAVRLARGQPTTQIAAALNMPRRQARKEIRRVLAILGLRHSRHLAAVYPELIE